ncbi:MAG: hypothetical protein K2F69_06125, partial [Bacteroidaceae bacterium]|nr:hypothetical protein [Bacteroidaceae bacterium]
RGRVGSRRFSEGSRTESQSGTPFFVFPYFLSPSTSFPPPSPFRFITIDGENLILDRVFDNVGWLDILHGKTYYNRLIIISL